MVPLKRSIKEVLNWVHPLVIASSFCAFSMAPHVSLLVTSTTRFFSVCLITVAIQRSGQISKQHLPRPAVFSTLSRNALTMLLGYGAHPSVHTSSARMD